MKDTEQTTCNRGRANQAQANLGISISIVEGNDAVVVFVVAPFVVVVLAQRPYIVVAVSAAFVAVAVGVGVAHFSGRSGLAKPFAKRTGKPGNETYHGPTGI